MSDGVLETIDSALRDWSVSRDAMRWNPQAAQVEAQSTNSADFSYAMLPASFSTASVTWAGLEDVREGDIITVYGLGLANEQFRVTRVTGRGSGSPTLDLEPADLSQIADGNRFRIPCEQPVTALPLSRRPRSAGRRFRRR